MTHPLQSVLKALEYACNHRFGDGDVTHMFEEAAEALREFMRIDLLAPENVERVTNAISEQCVEHLSDIYDYPSKINDDGSVMYDTKNGKVVVASWNKALSADKAKKYAEVAIAEVQRVVNEASHISQ